MGNLGEEFQGRTKETSEVRRNVCESSEGEVTEELRAKTTRKDLPVLEPV